MNARVGFVAIGRNEGERLVACLQSLARAAAGPIIYVDSGSTDQSVEKAQTLGAEIVRLDMSAPFTAARARNAGARRLIEQSDPALIQFIDGDCVLAPGWIEAASAFLGAHQGVAAVCGRRRELDPEASLYNRLCDIEWATPVGEAIVCGGDVLMRKDALVGAGFYNETLIAGEEPELCLRLRAAGWKIWRLDAEMTGHDAAMTRFGQWWTRARRSGHAYAEVSTLHKSSPLQIWRRETRRALVWAGIAPLSILLGLTVSPWFLTALALYPAQVLRLYLTARGRLGRDAAGWALTSILGKFAEAAGALRYYRGRVFKKRSSLFEYK
jgi:GT2 family glycosyltransferase